MSRRVSFFLITLLLMCQPKGLSAQEVEVPSDSVVRYFLEDALDIPFTGNNSVVLLPTGREKFDAMFNAIRQARHFIHLEYFNFRNDSIGHALFKLLGQKAAEGVVVRAMFDGYGNSSNDSPLKKHHIDSIRAMGIQVGEYDPYRFPWINHGFHRDHRKIVVIDGAVAYAGGMNVADYYINGSPEYGPWRDMHMELTGDVVDVYERFFARMWWEVSGEILLDEDYDKHSTRTRPANDFTLLPDTTSTAGNKRIGVVDRAPFERSKVMREAFVATIDAANHHIQIVNPYPTNVKSVRRALRRALKRGVRLEIMVSAKGDLPIVPDVVALEMKKLAKRGAEIYYNHDGFHHSKVMMVDDRFCTIGSVNLNSRSFVWDYEINSFILDRETTIQLEQMFEQGKQTCTRFYSEDYRSTFGFWQRLNGHFFSLFRFVL